MGRLVFPMVDGDMVVGRIDVCDAVGNLRPDYGPLFLISAGLSPCSSPSSPRPFPLRRSVLLLLLLLLLMIDFY